MGKAKALRLGITKGIAHVASVALPKTYHCPVCKLEFKAYDVAVEAKETGRSPEEIIAGHIVGCIGTLKGKAQCPDCGQSIRAKDFKDHMDKKHPIHAPENKVATAGESERLSIPEISPHAQPQEYSTDHSEKQ